MGICSIAALLLIALFIDTSKFASHPSFLPMITCLSIISFHILVEIFTITLKAFYQPVLEMQKSSCILCNQEFDYNFMRFEQRLILDSDFCVRCWDEIMSS
jgi:hypothetical protein